MSKQQIYRQRLLRASPDLDVASVALNDTGQNSDVLVVNGEFVFRFPKYPHVIQELMTEIAILAGLQGRLPLAIPDPTFVRLEGQPVGRAFVGYRIIEGEPLWRETFRTIRDEVTLDALAAQLSSFLHALHGVPVRETIDLKPPVADTREECADLYARMRNQLFPYMRPDARAWTTRHFETFVSDERNFTYQPVLKHGDFGPSNILYDAEARRIVGVIDFGSSRLGDPAYDFAGLRSGYGESFVRRCTKAYPELKSFMHRVRFYQGTFALLEALFGIENGDDEAFRDGIAGYV